MNAYDKALFYLSSREHTEKEIKTKLRGKGYPESEIADAISKLRDADYLSDERYAEVYLYSRMRKNPEGEYLLVMRLVEKGVDKSIASRIVGEFFEEEGHIPYLAKAIQKLQRTKGIDKVKEFFLRKGFKVQDINNAISALESAL